MSGSEEGAGETLVGEPIIPKLGTFDTSMMATGVPGVPHQFTWNDTEYTIRGIIETWKALGPCTSGSDEMYVRRHYYRIRTTSGDTMTLYCDRHAPRGRSRTKGRWVLYSMVTGK